jgi:hypothetical protein
MESHDVDLEAQQSLAPFVEERETDRGDVAHGIDEREGHSQQSMGANACAAARNVSSGEEDETQLAAIRELMQRAFARGGVWLTLGEIAEVTEFAEASISAQLRHLRKPHHGGHRVEKRRRSPLGAAPVARAGDLRRGPVIWEYRVLPATHAIDIVGDTREQTWREEKFAHSDCTSVGERDA